MVDKTNINLVYEQLTARYDRISMSTIKSVLKGKMKVKAVKVDFLRDKYVQPCLEEAEDAFKKFNCVIFTAFRGCFTLTENLARNARLKADMESLGMTFRPVNGCYREADWDYPCVEYCYFVYDAEKSDRCRADRRGHYNQSDRKCRLLASGPQLCSGQLADRSGDESYDPAKILP